MSFSLLLILNNFEKYETHLFTSCEKVKQKTFFLLFPSYHSYFNVRFVKPAHVQGHLWSQHIWLDYSKVSYRKYNKVYAISKKEKK